MTILKECYSLEVCGASDERMDLIIVRADHFSISQPW